MAISAPSRAWPARVSEFDQPNPTVGEPSVEVASTKVDEGTLLWRQVDSILQRSADRYVSRRRADSEGSTPGPRERVGRWKSVAPGIVLSSAEYERRFAGLDLNALRASMAPAVFEAFVRHVGMIDGNDTIDIVEAARVPDDR